MTLFNWQNFRSGGTRLSAENLNAAQQALLDEAQAYADSVGGGGGGGAPSGPAGGVLSGTYPDPGFAVDMATQAELDAHEADTSVHGIADTTALATDADVAVAVAAEAVARNAADTALDGRLDTLEAVDNATQAELDAHVADTTAVHGIADTSVLATDADVASAVSAHEADTSNVHGIADTTALATDAEVAAAVSAHNAATTVHGIDTTALATDVELAAGLSGKANTSHTHAQSDVTNLTTDLAAKAPLASPTFTGDPKAPTPAQGDNDTSVATTAYVQTEVGLMVPKSLVDAKGDLLVGTADNTVARLAGGTDGHVLTRDSAQATGLKWAPGTVDWPGFKSGDRYLPFGISLAGGSLAFSAGDLTATYFYAAAGVTVDLMSIRVVTAGTAGALVRLGWYALGTDGRPASLIATAGTLPTDSTGFKELTGFASRSLTGWVALAMLFEVAGSTVSTPSSSNARPSLSPFPQANVDPASVTKALGYRVTGVATGSLPSTFPATTVSNLIEFPPIISQRVA